MVRPFRRGQGQRLSAVLEQRPVLVRSIEGTGARWRRRRAEAERELAQIGELAAEARDAGASLSEVAELAGVSRPTLYKALRER